jgi:hypothetical protein
MVTLVTCTDVDAPCCPDTPCWHRRTGPPVEKPLGGDADRLATGTIASPRNEKAPYVDCPKLVVTNVTERKGRKSV